jgi:periplasmic divalent cation tolerance protein
MAKVTLHPSVQHIHGTVLGVVFKRGPYGQSLATAMPDLSHVKPSAGQRSQRGRMKAASAAYRAIKADPAQLADYERRAKAEGLSVWLLVSRATLGDGNPRPRAAAAKARTQHREQTDSTNAHGRIPCSMLLAWTTVATRSDADTLARGVIELNLAACVQIDGPITSHYRWEGQVERAEEFRLCFKLVPQQAAALEKHVLTHHPYATPEWLLVRAERVSEKYLSWATTNSSSAPL